MRLNCIWLSYLLMFAVLLGSSAHADPVVPFVPNDIMTTPCGPAFADISLIPKNFLPCEGGPFALCYYSGPETETCELIQDDTFANCKCFEIAYGKYFVLIHGILDTKLYLETVEKCGMDGKECFRETNKAPVCDSINRGEFIPGADMISTFSFDCALTEGIGQTNCRKRALYGGCMTAPCVHLDSDDEGIVTCSCPTFKGPFQVGQFNQDCDLGGNLVWSAAANLDPVTCELNAGGGTFPPPPTSGCIPDIPKDFGGCPLLIKNDIPAPPTDIDCSKVCQEYEDSQDRRGIELGFTCDATLCTSACNDRDLVDIACSGLQVLGVTEIIRLEAEAGCSCCASQICGCDANSETEQAIFDLNKRQRNRGIEPQCDFNDTLCGEESPGGRGSSCSLASIGTKPSFPLYTLIPALILIRRFWKIYNSEGTGH